jgi:hypothetical protein
VLLQRREHFAVFIFTLAHGLDAILVVVLGQGALEQLAQSVRLNRVNLNLEQFAVLWQARKVKSWSDHGRFWLVVPGRLIAAHAAADHEHLCALALRAHDHAAG